jgi:hypothetical protein
LPSESAAGLKLLPPVPGSPPLAPHAAYAVKLVVASNKLTKQPATRATLR